MRGPGRIACGARADHRQQHQRQGARGRRHPGAAGLARAGGWAWGWPPAPSSRASQGHEKKLARENGK
jgi:hypothetical protein